MKTMLLTLFLPLAARADSAPKRRHDAYVMEITRHRLARNAAAGRPAPVPENLQLDALSEPDADRAEAVLASQLDRCFANVVHGHMTLAVLVTGDPEVGTAAFRPQVKKDSLHVPAIDACLEDTIYAARLPAPSKAGVAILEMTFPRARL